MADTRKAPAEPLVSVLDLDKHFGPTIALDGVTLSFYPGKITGLIGENGSGKSTLTSIIAGMQQPTAGSMAFKGQPYKPATMIEAGRQGIGMIVQEQGYVPGITIAQNIFLGEEGLFRKMGVISKKAMVRAAKEALLSIGIDDIDPALYIDQLNLQDRKLIEIARIMRMDLDVLIVDETTTALSQKGRTLLYGIMDSLRGKGKAVIFISHDLDELMQVCDAMAVLRDGRLIAELDKADFSEDTIKRLMVGRELSGHYYRDDYETQENTTPTVLEVHQATSATGLLMNFSMDVKKGEILGIGGLSHCGMHELGKVLFGEEPLLTGSVTHTASGQSIVSARQAMDLGLGYVSKDRDQEALVLSASIQDNIMSAGLDRVKAGPFILPGKVQAYVNKQINNLSIKCASPKQNVQYLSGGNKQKVVFGKWVGRDCDILVLDCPTRGVDIGVKAAMYQLIEDIKNQGKTIVMISEELPELIGMCDRILILKDGRLNGEFERSRDLDELKLIERMI
ncbi:MAG: sugar ABC transporter ATP-binding protein [Clostridiales bacterium]|jgi:ribose transport system ATP-binding protein|nr:sugar ABC transporter ATP-binding protein [Clostridiales bacterium]